jgi:hypothetical protein
LPKTAPWLTSTLNVIPTLHSVTIRGVEDKCSGEGSFGIAVSSPRGSPANASIFVDGDLDSIGRGTVQVRYRNALNFTAASGPAGSKTIDASGISWIGPAGRTAAGATASVNCGRSDGTAAPIAGTPGAFRCTYTGASASVVVTYTVTDSTGSTYSASQTATIP